MKEDRIVLCGANSYDMKYYFNEQFDGIPESIKDYGENRKYYVRTISTNSK